MKRRIAWLLLSFPLFLSGCLATARANPQETVVNWKEKCEAKCKTKSYRIWMYHTDGKVEEMKISVYDFTNNIGCFCPLDAKKETK